MERNLAPSYRKDYRQGRASSAVWHRRTCTGLPDIARHFRMSRHAENAGRRLNALRHTAHMHKSSVFAIFEKWNPLLGSKTWNLPGVDTATLRRWREGSLPTGPSAKAVAVAVWRHINSEHARRLKEPIVDVIREVTLEAPFESWKTEETFGAWFFDLAEKERGTDTGRGTLPPPTTTLDLRVWRPESRSFVSVRELAGRPLHGGDRVQVHVTASAPLHLYLVWLTIDPQLNRKRPSQLPFHPWKESWQEYLPTEDVGRSILTIPGTLNQTLAMEEKPGLETIVLLARQEPLPEDDQWVKELPGKFEHALGSIKTRPKLANSKLLREFPDQKCVTAAESDWRLFKTGETHPIGDPVYELYSALGTELTGHFKLIRTLSVMNIGK